MADPADEPSPQASRKRVQPFLDCVAYLLAQRWLRDERQQEETPPRSESGPHGEEAKP